MRCFLKKSSNKWLNVAIVRLSKEKIAINGETQIRI